MRIGGLATGIDTDSIIKDMMQANRLPLDKITQKKQYLEWQLDDYRAVNRQLKDFSDNIFNNIVLSSKFSSKTVSVSSTDVTVKGAGSLGDFSGTINVERLAKPSSAISGKLGDTVNGDSTLESLGLSEDIKINISAIDENGVLKDLEKPLEFKKSDTLQSVLNRISKESGVNAFFDPKTKQIAVTSKHGGQIEGGKEIVMSGNLADTLKLNGMEVAKGQEAKFSMNGLEMTRSTNNFKLNGFEFTLNEANSKDISFSSAPDTDKILETVVKFVDDYNKLVEDLNKQVRESKYRSFQPLSAEQKKDMSEKEIELWEEKAKSGTLRNDPNITSMLSNMRTALMSSINGSNLSQIGISTTSAYMDNGKLVIDEKKLKEAITADPEKIHNLLSFDAGKTAKSDEHGLAKQVRTIVDATQTKIGDIAGKVGSVNNTFTLGKNLDAMNKQIERFEERMRMTENRLWKQFSAMETAIQRANAQSASLMSALGGGM